MRPARPEGVTRVLLRAQRGEHYLAADEAQLLALYALSLERRLRGFDGEQEELALDEQSPERETCRRQKA